MNTYKHLPEYLSNGRRLYSSFLSELRTPVCEAVQATHAEPHRPHASHYNNNQYTCLVLPSSSVHRTSAVRQELTSYVVAPFLSAHQ